MTYNSFLGLTNETGPNSSSVTLGYDVLARPNSTTSPFGATTTTSYSDTSSPPTATPTKWPLDQDNHGWAGSDSQS